MPDEVSAGKGPARFTLEDLIALNDEIAAMARAGMPLEKGLIELGREAPGRLGAMTGALVERMGRGEGLAEAIEAQGDRLPRIYRSVVEAGIRSGRLPAALEGLAAIARRVAETRDAMGLALVYPTVVLLVAYALFLGLVTLFVPRLVAASETFRLPIRGPLEALAWLGEWAPYWGPIPALFLLAAVFSWLRSGRAAGLVPGEGSPLRYVPWMGSMIALSEWAYFADLLALLVEHRVAFPEAIALASSASSSAALRSRGAQVAEAVARGGSPGDALGGGNTLPPLLRWLITVGERQGSLEVALRHAAHSYRVRASRRADLIATFAPLILLLTVGAFATLFYALALFLPMTALFRGLAS